MAMKIVFLTSFLVLAVGFACRQPRTEVAAPKSQSHELSPRPWTEQEMRQVIIEFFKRNGHEPPAGTIVRLRERGAEHWVFSVQLAGGEIWFTLNPEKREIVKYEGD